MTAPRVLSGVVEQFDEGRGLGVIAGTDGASWSFHCTALVDGTRTVAVGARVAFVGALGHLGRPEARSVAVV